MLRIKVAVQEKHGERLQHTCMHEVMSNLAIYFDFYFHFDFNFNYFISLVIYLIQVALKLLFLNISRPDHHPYTWMQNGTWTFSH